MNLGLLLVGIFFSGIGILLLRNHLKSKKNNTASVQAEVVSYDTEVHTGTEHEDSVYYYPVMRYFVAGKWYEKRRDVGKGRKEYAIGELVPILYDPNQPENFTVDGDLSTAVVSWVALGIGLGLIILAFVNP